MRLPEQQTHRHVPLNQGKAQGGRRKGFGGRVDLLNRAERKFSLPPHTMTGRRVGRNNDTTPNPQPTTHNDKEATYHNVLALLDCLDVVGNRGVGPDAVLVHQPNQIRLVTPKAKQAEGQNTGHDCR